MYGNIGRRNPQKLDDSIAWFLTWHLREDHELSGPQYLPTIAHSLRGKPGVLWLASAQGKARVGMKFHFPHDPLEVN